MQIRKRISISSPQQQSTVRNHFNDCLIKFLTEVHVHNELTNPLNGDKTWTS